jgi:hypothetical protein
VITLERRVEFAAKHIRNKEGEPWSAAGRDWVCDEFWGPAFGWKTWIEDPSRICDECVPFANEVVPWVAKHPSQKEDHRATGCMGLRLEPIIFTVLNLPRREGKTFNTGALNIATLCLEPNTSITYVASSEDQTAQLFEENYAMPIRQSPALRKTLRVVGNKVYNDRNKSFFEFVPTSHSSITGRGRTMVQIDEARDIDARVAMALIPSILDQHGLECPKGCVKHRQVDPKLRRCSVCRSNLRPWFARAVIMSSSGLMDGGDRDWFPQLVEQLESQPAKNYHLFRLDKSTNPSVSAKTKDAVEDVFGKLDATRTLVDIEMNNQARRKGEDFVSISDVHAVVDQQLLQMEGHDLRCVGFLDTSLTQDVTSLVIAADDPVSSYPWEHLLVTRIDAWNPKKMQGGVIDREAIQAHLDRVVPMHPGLIDLWVDVRGMPWAIDLVKFNNQQRRGWGRKVKSFHGQTKERDLGWVHFEERILNKRIRMPPNKTLIEELKGLRRIHRLDGTDEIRDRSRKKRHADIAEGIASSCYAVFLLMARPQVSLRQANASTGPFDLRKMFQPQVRMAGSDGKLDITKF